MSMGSPPATSATGSFAHHRPIPPPSSVRSVPRVFQAILIAYVLLTGELIRGIQAALLGLQGGGEGAFTLAVLLAIAIDLARVAPLFFYARHPLGILHPLILTTVLWPLLVAMPGKIEELGGFSGLLLGEPVSPPFYSGLGWLPGPEIWPAVAWANLCELITLLSIYTGFALSRERRGMKVARPVKQREFDGKKLRILAIVLLVVSVAALLTLISTRGGLTLHLTDMARGRFRSLAGMGPLIAAVDLGLIALIAWVAARPNDVKLPIFIILLGVASIAQFISNGARSAAFAAIMMVGLTWALRTRRIPWRLALLMLPLFFLAFGALNIVRTAGWSGQDAGEAISAAQGSDVLARAQEEIDLRRSLQSSVPVISQGHELMGGPLWGSSYQAAVFAFVPRIVWPEKPRGPGSLYTQNFLGEVREGFAVPITPTAEAYWNFGMLGIILIAALYGALIRLAHRIYAVRQDQPFIVAAFVVFVTTFHPSTDDLVLFQQQMFLLAIVYLLALIFALRTKLPAADPRSMYPAVQPVQTALTPPGRPSHRNPA
jgi:hypothetical protein